MQILVRMLANHVQDDDRNDPLWRIVTVAQEIWDGLDDDDCRLEQVFYYGQNDFQPVAKCCSVSVGDVVYLPDDPSGGALACAQIKEKGDVDAKHLRTYFAPHVCKPMGFGQLEHDQVIELEAMKRRDRQFCKLVCS